MSADCFLGLVFIIIVVILLLVIFIVAAVLRVEKIFTGAQADEAYIHPRPEHDQKSGSVVFKGSPTYSSYRLVLLDSSGAVKKTLDSKVTDGLTDTCVLNSGGKFESIQLNLLANHNVSLNDDVYQMAKTKTTDRMHALTAEEPNSSVTLKTKVSEILNLDYNNGDVLSFSNLDINGILNNFTVKLFIDNDTIESAPLTFTSTGAESKIDEANLISLSV